MNDLVKLLLDKGLPLLATAVVGPLGGAAVGLLADKLGLSSNTVEAVKQAVAGISQADLLALKTLEAKMAQAELDADAKAQDEVTKRWQADMTADTWLSKNVRPLTLVYWTVVISLMAFASQWVKVDPMWVDLLKYSYVTILSAYFVGRTAQHVVNLFTRNKT